jgi:hypothetical protein
VLHTEKEELDDKARWMRIEAADVVAECERCYVGYRLPAPAESSSSTSLPTTVGVPSDAVSRYDLSEHETSTTSTSVGDPRLGSAIAPLAEDSSPPSFAQQTQRGNASMTASMVSEAGDGGVGADPGGLPSRHILLLEREIAVLKDNLNQHLGTLHRQRVLESGVEAERQTLYNKLRAYRDQLAQRAAALERAKVEASTSKAMHIKWENDLGARNRSLREGQRHLSGETERLKAELAQAKVRRPLFFLVSFWQGG